jgi:hypothetical protein
VERWCAAETVSYDEKADWSQGEAAEAACHPPMSCAAKGNSSKQHEHGCQSGDTVSHGI